MKHEANWLVKELDNKEHVAHENMNGLDQEDIGTKDRLTEI